jgi:hypothetical protein
LEQQVSNYFLSFVFFCLENPVFVVYTQTANAGKNVAIKGTTALDLRRFLCKHSLLNFHQLVSHGFAV